MTSVPLRRRVLCLALSLSAVGCSTPSTRHFMEAPLGVEPADRGGAVQSPLAEGVGRDSAWRHLVGRYDTDADQCITLAEHGRGEAAFVRLDRDHDGVLTEADFVVLESHERQPMRPGAVVRVGGPLGRCADTDDDGLVVRADWELFVSRICADDRLDRAVFGGLGLEANRLPYVTRVLDADRDGEVTRAELSAFFDVLDLDGDGRLAAVEFGSDEMLQAPPEGAEAPDFELPRVEDPSWTIRLSSFRGERPVALIFGSYT